MLDRCAAPSSSYGVRLLVLLVLLLLLLIEARALRKVWVRQVRHRDRVVDLLARVLLTQQRSPRSRRQLLPRRRHQDEDREAHGEQGKEQRRRIVVGEHQRRGNERASASADQRHDWQASSSDILQPDESESVRDGGIDEGTYAVSSWHQPRQQRIERGSQHRPAVDLDREADTKEHDAQVLWERRVVLHSGVAHQHAQHHDHVALDLPEALADRCDPPELLRQRETRDGEDGRERDGEDQQRGAERLEAEQRLRDGCRHELVRGAEGAIACTADEHDHDTTREEDRRHLHGMLHSLYFCRMCRRRVWRIRRCCRSFESWLEWKKSREPFGGGLWKRKIASRNTTPASIAVALSMR